MGVPHTTLKALAAAVWYVGGGVMLYRSGEYLLRAAWTGPFWPTAFAVAVALGMGVIRGRTVFLRVCQRNLQRIEGLERPRVWQFFRPWFFAALGLMLAAGAALTAVATTGYWGMVVVGALELTIATGLLTSSVAFWGEGAGRALVEKARV